MKFICKNCGVVQVMNQEGVCYYCKFPTDEFSNVKKDNEFLEIECIGKNCEVSIFNLCSNAEIENINNYTNYIYRIYSKEIINAIFFEITLTITINNMAIITMMNNHDNKEFFAKGIPDFMILWLSKKHAIKIHSSTNKIESKVIDEERRDPPATKVWERMIKKEYATFDEFNDRFIINKNM